MTQCPVTSGPSGAFLATPYSGETILLGGPQSQGCSGSGARGPWEPRLLPAALPQVVHLRGCRRAGAGEISIHQSPSRAKLRPAQAPPTHVRALPGPGPAQAPPSTLKLWPSAHSWPTCPQPCPLLGQAPPTPDPTHWTQLLSTLVLSAAGDSQQCFPDGLSAL